MIGLAVVAGSTAVLLLDALGSIATRPNSRHYAALAPLSRAIWLGAGAFGAWSYRADWLPALTMGALAGGAVGLVDATAGWWISTALGATPMQEGGTWAFRLRAFSPRVTARAAVIGALGGVLASLAHQWP